MKKTYEKPQILFESFTLSTNINAGCENPTNLPSQNQCGIDFSGYSVFAENMTGCENKKIDTTEAFNGICYHAPDPGNNLFTS